MTRMAFAARTMERWYGGAPTPSHAIPQSTPVEAAALEAGGAAILTPLSPRIVRAAFRARRATLLVVGARHVLLALGVSPPRARVGSPNPLAASPLVRSMVALRAAATKLDDDPPELTPTARSASRMSTHRGRSAENIVIQVIGEVSNKAGEPKKFVQTFVLAQQPSGHFVLSDILRYINEDFEEEAEEATPEAAPATEAPAVVELAVEAKDADAVDQKLE
ncbi:hypothetical protein B0T24DRAFT_598330 [Lasiosphaeria ovina]|uniref:NTF2 domain-containing protein n=1 Tax=Lasiosphaeria ovina TaxID=92902 RepID=A0AAE0JWH7_9PEZI|nr:hypothetical protein B0T24DRAFT_598330 [Lasiosphaeria ovina]